jgi:hypothetical protein
MRNWSWFRASKASVTHLKGTNNHPTILLEWDEPLSTGSKRDVIGQQGDLEPAANDPRLLINGFDSLE